jgi:hypothetical protein
LFERTGLENKHAAHVATRIVLERAGFKDFSSFRETADVGEILASSPVEFQFVFASCAP